MAGCVCVEGDHTHSCVSCVRSFVDLVEREWLDGGHQFSLRHHPVTHAPEKERAPVFLLFLDAVWQVRGGVWQ